MTAQLDRFGWFALTAGEVPTSQLLASQSESQLTPVKLTSSADHPTPEAIPVQQPKPMKAIAPVAPKPPVEPVVWSNERIALKVRPYRRGPLGFILRYRDAQSHYRFVWELKSQSASFIKLYQGDRTVLAAKSLPYVASQTYQLKVVTEADTITISVNGELIFDIRDSDIPSGVVALNCATDMSLCFEQIMVE